MTIAGIPLDFVLLARTLLGMALPKILPDDWKGGNTAVSILAAPIGAPRRTRPHHPASGAKP